MYEYLKIGELADLTGITIRTLHYYDEIGLLKPTCITESNHRLYDTQSLNRLYLIIAMKDMGFSLEEIKNIIFTKEINIQELIDIQIVRMQDEISQKQLLLGKLLKVKQSLKENHDIQPEDFQDLIQFINLSADRYFTVDQLYQLKDTHKNADNKAEINLNWFEFISKLTNCYNKKLTKTDLRVVECSDYWKQFNQKLIGTDERMQKSIQEFHSSSESDSIKYGLTRELYQYLLSIID